MSYIDSIKGRVLLYSALWISLLRPVHSTPSISSMIGSYSNKNPLASKSKCLGRVPIPHFMTTEFTLPASDLHEADECEAANMGASTRTNLAMEDSDFRLPKCLKPTHYTLKMCPNLQAPFDFSGSVVIDFNVLENTNNVTLNILDLAITGVHIWEDVGETPSSIEDQKLKNTEEENLTKAGRQTEQQVIDYELIEELYNNFVLNKSQEDISQHFNDSNSVIGSIDILQYFENILASIKNSFKENEITAPIIEKERTSTTIAITKTEREHEVQKVIFQTETQLQKDRKYKIKLSFNGTLNDELLGFYKTFYIENDGVTRMSAVTQFQVSEARRAFPCFDEPSYKATFDISLCRELNMTSLSNMPIIDTVPFEGRQGMVWDVFDTTVPMSTYLVAFAVTNFEYKVCQNFGVPFKVWVPSPIINHTDFACAVAPRLLTFFQEYFDVEYPLPKMDLVGLPHFFALGMENWGLVTFIIDRLAVMDPQVNLVNSRNVLETISHEIAHQWFGNLVTPHWWSDIWLNEGFATYLSILGADHIHPEWNKLKGDIVDIQQRVLVKDSFESSHAIVVDVNHPNEYVAIFDEISYGKGCFLIRMLVHVLTEKTFRRGLQDFLKKFKYSNARQEDLWGILTETGHKEGTLPKDLHVAEIMENWIYQEGYPVVSITRFSDGSGIATQKRYFFEADEEEDLFRNHVEKGTVLPKWWIPLSLTNSSSIATAGTNPKYWLRADTEKIVIDKIAPDGEWYLANLQQTGFFRVNYDINNWELLIKQLQVDHLVFDEMTRSQMIDDAFTLAYSGELAYSIPLSMLDYIYKESSPYVIKAAVDNVSPILEAFTHDALYGNFKNLIITSFGNHLPSMSFNHDQHELPFIKSTKNFIVQHFCKISKPCIQEAKNLFSIWTKHKANYSFVESDLLRTVFCIAVAEGGETEWNILMREANSGRYPDKQQDLVDALSCTKEKWLLSKLLSKLTYARDNTIDFGTLPFALHAVAQNPIGIDVAWEFIKSIWTRVADSFFGDVLLEAVIPHVRSEYHYHDVLEFLQDLLARKNKLDYQLKFMSEVTHNIKRKINFYSRHYESFVNWFKEREENFNGTYVYMQRMRRQRPKILTKN